MSNFKQYRRTQIAEMRPWEPLLNMSRVSVSAPDKDAGSPKMGDMIARNPKNHDDMWLVAAQYFADNFEPMTAPVPSDIDGPAGEAGDLIEPVAWQWRYSYHQGEWGEWTHECRFTPCLAEEKRGLVPASALAAYQADLAEAAEWRERVAGDYGKALDTLAAAEAKAGELEQHVDDLTLERDTARAERRQAIATIEAAEAKVAALTASLKKSEHETNMLVSWCASHGDEPDLMLSEFDRLHEVNDALTAREAQMIADCATELREAYADYKERAAASDRTAAALRTALEQGQSILGHYIPGAGQRRELLVTIIENARAALSKATQS